MSVNTAWSNDINFSKKDDPKLENVSLYKRVYNTSRLMSEEPKIDGVLNDECWKEGSWSQDYVQHAPSEGNKASERTVLKILYDDNNIYVAFRCYDSHPDQIQHLTGKRDEIVGDVVGINFDSYYDHRTGYEFNITAGGSKIDLLLKNDGVPDFNWDAVWYGKTALEDSAWTAEMQIPLSQLRYNNKQDQVWGMHSWRWINRYQEEDQWSLIPRNNTGFIYNFGELHGISNLPKSRRIEFLPYTLDKLHKSPVEDGNPFSKDYRNSMSFGLDGKLGVGSDFTLDYTVNPDFGQVEADPSVMNLSALETFYAEKRPFFLEGKNVIDYNLENDLLFYSRRIGRSPSVIPESDSDNKKYIWSPEFTTILDAVKFSGKTSQGFSIGVMQSTTNEEYSTVDSAGIRKNVISEPYTNYFLLRTQKDFNAGNTIIGIIASSTNRSINSNVLYEMNKNAFTGGIDFLHYWNNRNYFVSFNLIGSEIDGNQKAIAAVQNSAVHYYQRPDAKYLGVDSSLRSLTGNGGIITIGKAGTGRLKIEEKVSWRSPGLELNDIGFLQMADYIRQQVNIHYKETKPTKIFREYNVNIENINQWTYGGLNEKNTTLLNAFGQFHNKWGAAWWLFRQHSAYETRELRGGPAIKSIPFWHSGIEVFTDWSKPFSANIHLTGSVAPEANSSDFEIGPGIGIRLNSRFYINSNFFYGGNNYNMMYVATVEKPTGNKYFMGHLDQKTYNLTVRLNFNLTSDLSIQYYGSPFVSQGKYREFKLVTNPGANKFTDRFLVMNDEDVVYNSNDNNYTININSDKFTFDNPDFNSREFRSNLVFRWEYKVGSVLYMVWSHQRSNYDKPYSMTMFNSYKSLFNTDPHNIFMLKFNYYFSI